MKTDGRKRVVIEHVTPCIDGGRFPVKRVIGETVSVEADIFSDGHDVIGAELLYRSVSEKKWHGVPMTFVNNDRWQGEFAVTVFEDYVYTLRGWVNHFLTWQRAILKKIDAAQDIKTERVLGHGFLKEALGKAKENVKEKLKDYAGIITQSNDTRALRALLSDEYFLGLVGDCIPKMHMTEYPGCLRVQVENPKAVFSTWYEVFPRSTSGSTERHGTFADCEKILPDIAQMGFDVIYFPPIHPIGGKHRKGRNNALAAATGDPGSPWAIGAKDGGHKAVHSELGSPDDFKKFIRKARDHGLEVAMDLAYQCSPDHPYVKEHPEWFRWRPDGKVQFAENPPKKYEDIIPFDFESEAWEPLWEELKSIVLYWIEQGVRIFRVDNPHTKPFAFWAWMLDDIRQKHPDAIFLAEAFTRPKVMYELAKIGFHQSYTYFTWRTTKQEFTDYLTEMTRTEVREYFRPNFWPNTPDILSAHLQHAGPAAFRLRLILAATLSSNYGIYGPAYEVCANTPYPDKEEYADNEKYEIKNWNLGGPETLRSFITRMNQIRKNHKAFQTTWNVYFHHTENDNLLFYSKVDKTHNEVFLIIVNIDPLRSQSGWIRVPIGEWGIRENEPYQVQDMLSQERFTWINERNFVKLDPEKEPAHILRLAVPTKNV